MDWGERYGKGNSAADDGLGLSAVAAKRGKDCESTSESLVRRIIGDPDPDARWCDGRNRHGPMKYVTLVSGTRDITTLSTLKDRTNVECRFFFVFFEKPSVIMFLLCFE